jgi:hypothetical protein
MMSNVASIPLLGMSTVSLTINGVLVKLVNCFHTPGLQASLYSLWRHHRSPGCAFVSDYQGMYLTFGKIYTRIQDELDCRIQFRPLPPHPNLRCDIDHTNEQAVTKPNITSVSPSKNPILHIPPSSLANPITHHDPTPKSFAVLPVIPPTPSDVPLVVPSSFQPFLLPQPSSKDYPVTGSPAIRHLTYFNVHRYIGFQHLVDYTDIHKCVTGIRVSSQGEPPLSPEDLTTIGWNNKGKPLSLPTHFLEKVSMDIGYGTPTLPGGLITLC